MFRHRRFEPIIEVRDGDSRAPWPRTLELDDEVTVYSEDFSMDNLNAIRVRITAIDRDRIQGVVSRPTRYFLKDIDIDKGDEIEFNEKAIFAFA